MKKRVLSGVLAGTMIVSLAACSASPDPETTAAKAEAGAAETTAAAAADTTAAAAETTAAAVDTGAEDANTLSVYAWDKNFNIPALQAAEADYKKNVNPDFKLNIIEQSQSSDVENAITLAGSAGDYSTLPDIVLFQDHYFKKYQLDYPDAFADLNGVDVDWSDFGTEKLDYSTVDGVHYGFPVDNGTVIFAYRTDLLEQAGYTLDERPSVHDAPGRGRFPVQGW